MKHITSSSHIVRSIYIIARQRKVVHSHHHGHTGVPGQVSEEERVTLLLSFSFSFSSSSSSFVFVGVVFFERKRTAVSVNE